jgi:peptidoglycan/xylan/chitin deacetylase (PgdA/CDA1 family)
MRRIFIWTILILGLINLAGYLPTPNSYEVPILMYHEISDNPQSPTHVTPGSFRKQMQFLKKNHYRVIPLLELAGKIESEKTLPRKTVVITFDDGTADNFTNALPILREMNLPATVFMITGQIGQKGFLSESQLKTLDTSGVSIGSHTQDHAFLPHLSEKEIRYQLETSKSRLENILGHPVLFLSYPAGGTSRTIIQFAKESGYRAAVTTNFGKDSRNVFCLHRIKINPDQRDPFEFWLKLTGFYHLQKKRIPI